MQSRNILERHTDLIEPLSLDEAYLDVTENRSALPTGTAAISPRDPASELRPATNCFGNLNVAVILIVAGAWHAHRGEERYPQGLPTVEPLHDH